MGTHRRQVAGEISARDHRAGCAFLDYDNDGWMDIYLVNSGKCDFYNPNPPLRNALYRNNRDGTFTDVTEKAGVAAGGYGQGVAVGDYDGDGFPDLYVTQYGRSILYHNNGDGTFTDVTEKAGVAAPGWASSAVWFDYDNDGRLDLFVCRFVDFDKSKNLPCTAYNKPGYCVPAALQADGQLALPQQRRRHLHRRQQGDRESAKYLGKAWGVVATDINNDGKMDLFVANDTAQNFLFVNRGNGKFEEIGNLAGVAYSDAGRPRSGMGVDSADFNQDGWMDLFVANIDHERFSLYQNNQDETFDDHADAPASGMATRLMSGWGLKFFDYDNDGNLDLFLCQRQSRRPDRDHAPGRDLPGAAAAVSQRRKDLQNVSAESGPSLSTKRLSARGLALGDFNNDGAVDVLISRERRRADAAAQHMRPKTTTGSECKLVGKKANRDAIGARITYQAGDLKRSRMKVGGGSYLSSHDPRVVLGIGTRTKIDWVEVKWPEPSGETEKFTDLPIDKYITITEGEGLKKGVRAWCPRVLPVTGWLDGSLPSDSASDTP